MSLSFGSVCSGIGCAELAFERLGWRGEFVSEIEAFPRAVLKHRFPAVPLHGDFTTIQAGDYGRIDLLVGGTPCQSFSVAGLRLGLADERGNLALEYLQLADRLRPRWLVWENVPGVLSSNGGRDFGAFLGGLAELGYGWAYRVLDAQHFGVAQRRRRVFVVGYAGDWRRAAAVLFEPASLRGDPAPRREAGEGTAGALTCRPGRGGTNREGGDGSLIAGTLCNSGKAAGSATQQDAEAGLLVAHTLRVPSRGAAWRGDGSDNFVAHTLRASGFDASEDGTGRGTPLVPITFDLAHITSAANRTRVEPGLPSPTLAKDSRMHVAQAFDVLGLPAMTGARETDVHSALRARPPGTSEASTTTVVQQAMAVRRLTPRECERLQGLPDDWTLIPWRKGMAPDGPRYKAIGNGMAVPCLEWIGQRIAAVEAQAVMEAA
jgi:DNA (cytosine-5)-methyltransferase 1